MYKIPTKAQRQAFWALFQRAYDCSYDTKRNLWRRYLQFRHRFWYSDSMGCYMISSLWGMTIGIEADGYTHS